MQRTIIGDCTLIHADCMQVLPALEADGIDCVISDPPYGITDLSASKDAYNDTMPDLPVLWKHLQRVCQKAAVTAMFASGRFTNKLWHSNEADFSYALIWIKSASEHNRPYTTGFLDAKNRPLRAHENVLIFIPKGQYKQSTYNPLKTTGEPYTIRGNRSARLYRTCRLSSTSSDGERYPNDILYFPIDGRRCNCFVKDHVDTFHPSTKPVPLLQWLVKSYSNEGNTVLDPFMGSGSTGIACLQSNRKFIGIECEKKWYDVACERIQWAYQEKRDSERTLFINDK